MMLHPVFTASKNQTDQKNKHLNIDQQKNGSIWEQPLKVFGVLQEQYHAS